MQNLYRSKGPVPVGPKALAAARRKPYYKRMKALSGVLFSLIFCFSAPAGALLYAQNWSKAIQQAEAAFARTGAKSFAPANRAVTNSAARAQAVSRSLKSSLRPDRTLQTLYPAEKWAVKNRNAVAAGWILTDNKLLVSQLAVRAKTLRTLAEESSRWTSQLRHTPSFQAADAAARIPAAAKYVFLGEYHNYPDLTQTLQQTVLEYQRLHPEKQIIVFSEFIKDSFPLFVKPGVLAHAPVFDYYAGCFYRAGLSVAGLEEEAPLRLFALLRQDPHETLLGMRTRNAHWAQRLRQWREKYPDAVFFIHAGGGHVGYQEPFAVSQQFPAGETFVVQFMPAHFSAKELREDEMFHALTRGKFYKSGTWFWSSRRYARLAGFDAQVIFPVENPYPKEYE